MAESLKEDGRPSQQWYWDDWFSEFGLRLCSLAARGLWIDMLGIMFKAEIRGTLAVNGRQIDNKSLAKIIGEPEKDINALIDELKENDVFSRLDNGTIISRRMYRESVKKDEISKMRSVAGKKGMLSRWGKDDNKSDNKKDNKKITKITTSSSSPSSSSSSKQKYIVYNFENREWENISEEDLVSWAKTYPLCDIGQELLYMADWLLSNPDRRKSNYRRFISNWRKKTQDKGGTKAQKKTSSDDWAERKTRELQERGEI